MVKYNKLEDETINLIDSDVPSLVDKHFQGIYDLLEEQNTPVSDRVKALFELNEVSTALKYLIKYGSREKLDTTSHHASPKERKSMKNLFKIIKCFNAKECKCLDNILKQYGEKIKDQDSKNVNVFKAIKLFFSNILAKFKSKSLKSFDIVYSKEVFEENESQEVTFLNDTKKLKVSKSPALETIVEEDDNTTNAIEEAIYNVRNGNEQVSHQKISVPATKIVQEEVVLHANRQLVKPLIPKKRNQKTDETQTYTSKLEGINLKPANKKPQIAPKPTIKTYSQAEEQYGKNVAGKKQFFESLSSNINPKSKVKGKVERLVEKFESKNQEVAAGRSR